MKRAIFFLLLIMALSASAIAASVSVNVNDFVSSELKIMHEEEKSGLLFREFELFNSGSAPYLARIRVSLNNASGEVFSGWTKEGAVMPGERKIFPAYAYAASGGNYTEKIYGHYAHDSFELAGKNITVEAFPHPEAEILISNPRVYAQKITLDVESGTDEKNVVVMPYSFPVAWIAGQKEIPSLRKGRAVRISIPYESDVFLEKPVSFIAVSGDGRALGKASFLMRPESGISKYLYLALDWIRGA